MHLNKTSELNIYFWRSTSLSFGRYNLIIDELGIIIIHLIPLCYLLVSDRCCYLLLNFFNAFSLSHIVKSPTRLLFGLFQMSDKEKAPSIVVSESQCLSDPKAVSCNIDITTQLVHKAKLISYHDLGNFDNVLFSSNLETFDWIFIHQSLILMKLYHFWISLIMKNTPIFLLKEWVSLQLFGLYTKFKKIFPSQTRPWKI